MKVEEVKKIIINEVQRQCNIEVADLDKNLFLIEFGIFPRDMIQIITNIENLLGFKITDIFISDNSDVMTVNNIAKKIMEIEGKKPIHENNC